MIHIQDLPMEIIKISLSYLSFRSLQFLMTTNKFFGCLIKKIPICIDDKFEDIFLDTPTETFLVRHLEGPLSDIQMTNLVLAALVSQKNHLIPAIIKKRLDTVDNPNYQEILPCI